MTSLVILMNDQYSYCIGFQKLLFYHFIVFRRWMSQVIEILNDEIQTSFSLHKYLYVSNSQENDSCKFQCASTRIEGQIMKAMRLKSLRLKSTFCKVQPKHTKIFLSYHACRVYKILLLPEKFWPFKATARDIWVFTFQGFLQICFIKQFGS